MNKTQGFDIQLSNFLNILRSGAFEESKPIGIMSDFKWKKLVNLANYHHLIRFFANGLERYYYNENLNFPADQIEVVKKLLADQPPTGFAGLYDFGKIHLHSKKYNERLKNIVSEEYANSEKSYETMQVMAIMMVNVENILTGKSFLRGILDLGRYLRLEGNKVDFVKLENWLARTSMSRMADLQGNLLIVGFGFSKEELPFLGKIIPQAERELKRAVNYDKLNDTQSWNFHEGKGGFIVSSPNTALKSIRHAWSYLRYAPREAMATIYRGIIKGLTEIEE